MTRESIVGYLQDVLKFKLHATFNCAVDDSGKGHELKDEIAAIPGVTNVDFRYMPLDRNDDAKGPVRFKMIFNSVTVTIADAQQRFAIARTIAAIKGVSSAVPAVQTRLNTPAP